LIESLLFYLLLGSIAGLISGLFGLGGGVILVPALAWLFTSEGFPPNLIMQMAIATSLATIIATSISSMRAHHQAKAINWETVFQLAPGIIVGSLVGAYLAGQLSTILLKQIFAFFLIAVSMQLFFQLQPETGEKALTKMQKRVGGLVIGTLSALLGIGGGSITVPFLIQAKVPARKAVAISSACGLPIALSGSLGYLIVGWNVEGLPANSFGYLYLPALLGIVASSVLTAPIGAKLAHQLAAQTLKRWFSLLLVIIGLKLLY
jgi:uncharacterized membrane protein YfcA